MFYKQAAGMEILSRKTDGLPKCEGDQADR